MYGHHIYTSKSKDQLGKIANPAGGQLNRENAYFKLRDVQPINGEVV